MTVASRNSGIADRSLGSNGSFVQADHPWTEEAQAELYDLFPFSADLPLYLALAKEQGGNVLELCCGTGRVLVPLVEAGHRVVGLDISPPMLALARRKLEAAGPAVAALAQLVTGDLRTVDLGGGFDLAVLAAKSFVYLTERADQQRALNAIATQLRPGGLLAIDLLHPSPAWLSQLPGSLRQDLVQHDPERGITLARTETVISTDLASQVRVIRSAYELVAPDGSLTKRFVEWPFRFTYRFEAEHLLERAGLVVEAVYGGYQREPFRSDSPLMLFLARRPLN